LNTRPSPSIAPFEDDHGILDDAPRPFSVEGLEPSCGIATGMLLGTALWSALILFGILIFG
jgi:hypothetical protein